MPAASLGHLTAGIAGTAGTSSAAAFGFAAFRVSGAHPVPAGVWAAAAALAMAALVTGSLGLVLDYRLRSRELQAATELTRTRLETHRAIMEKAAGEPASAQSYHDLILADALYLSVEQNQARLSDRAHRHLYGQRGGRAR